LRFARLGDLEAAARAVGGISRDSEALALRVAHDGSVRALKSLIDRLDENAIAVDSLSVHTPDLDDVFLALTDKAHTDKAHTGKPKVATP